MILPDVNVLIYAFRSDADRHDEYKAWLENVINSPAAYGMSPQVLASVVRICTHPRIFTKPSTLTDVFDFSRALMDQPNAHAITPGERHWQIFSKLCFESKATGNIAQDAWFAALAVESGCEWVTTDQDYARFKGLTWRSPL